MKVVWHPVVLLPVLLLPIALTQAQTCSNGLEGFDHKDGEVCCHLDCGGCGGADCAQMPGGREFCCSGGIVDTQELCSVTKEAPCVIDEEAAPAQTCSNGLEGYDYNGEVCCPLSCGGCGGKGCAKLPGGGESCCSGAIAKAQDLCSVTKEAPCVIDGEAQTCSNGLEGFDHKDGEVCCSLSCGGCGGKGCAKLPGGGESCCSGAIAEAQDLCSVTKEAPCVIDGEVEDDDDEGDDDEDDDDEDDDKDDDEDDDIPATPSFDDSSPTPVMTIPTSCDSDSVPTFRYAASSGKVEKGRLYAETEGCFTMTDIYNWRGTVSSGGVISSKGPIYQLNDNGDVVTDLGDGTLPVTNKWLLAAELYMTNGAIFYCKGSRVGGDCDELRIQSNGPKDWYEVRGHGGSLYFENTVVTSWDTTAKKPQETYEGGRSFLNCVSEKLTGETCEGRAKNERGECRMDIIDSEMGYMGWFDSESYGLTWKVRGFCKDLSNHEVFTTTNVYGDIKGSDIHHMYYGHYSYGHQGGVWTNNKMHDNHQYGFDPHDDSDYLTIAHNEVYDNFNHGIIASKRCNNVKIYDNTVYGGGPDAVGIFLHRSSDDAEVYDNVIYDMPDAGIAMLESMNADIHDNSIDNVQYGIRMSLGSAGNNVHDNTFNACSDYGLFTYQGTDAPTVTDGRPKVNTFHNNKVTDTAGGVKLKFSDHMVVTNNEFTGTEEVEFFDAQDTTWSGNTLPTSGVCIDNISSDKGKDIRASTFSVSDGLPSKEC